MQTDGHGVLLCTREMLAGDTATCGAARRKMFALKDW